MRKPATKVHDRTTVVDQRIESGRVRIHRIRGALHDGFTPSARFHFASAINGLSRRPAPMKVSERGRRLEPITCTMSPCVR